MLLGAWPSPSNVMEILLYPSCQNIRGSILVQAIDCMGYSEAEAHTSCCHSKPARNRRPSPDYQRHRPAGSGLSGASNKYSAEPQVPDEKTATRPVAGAHTEVHSRPRADYFLVDGMPKGGGHRFLK
jgi:hypothetical protein